MAQKKRTAGSHAPKNAGLHAAKQSNSIVVKPQEISEDCVFTKKTQFNHNDEYSIAWQEYYTTASGKKKTPGG